MENKGCITCRKCKQVRSNFFCGRTRLSQKQLYNEHGFCSDYEPEEQIEKPLTNDEWRRTCSTEEFATVIYGIAMYDTLYDRIHNAFVLNPCEDDSAGINEVVRWLKEKHDGNS